MSYNGVQQVLIANSNDQVLAFGHVDYASSPEYDSDYMYIVENDFVFTQSLRVIQWFYTGSTPAFVTGDLIPTKFYGYKDDFLGATISPWTATVFGGLSEVALVSMAGGGVKLTSGSVFDQYARLDLNGVKKVSPSYGCSVEIRPTAYDTTNVEVHFGLLVSGLDTAVRFWHIGGNWQATCIVSGTPETVDTGVSSSSLDLPEDFTIECKNPWVEFRIGGDRVAIIDENIPSSLAEPYVYIETTSTGAVKEMTIDHIAFEGNKL